MRTLRVVHRWLGIALAAPLVVLGLTGAILTLEPVWPGWGTATPLSSAPPATADAILAAAQAAAPPGMRAARYTPPQATGAPVTVAFARLDSPRGGGMVMDFDPATAKPLGPARSTDGVLSWIRRLHTNFLAPEFGGRQIAGWCGVGLLLLTLLGLPLWWPGTARWRSGFVVPVKASGLRLHRALHGAAGIWLVAMLLATSVTGIVQGFPQTSRALLGLSTGGPPRQGRGTPGEIPPLPALDAAIRLAQAALPGTVLRAAMLPGSARDPVRLFMTPPGGDGAVATRVVTIERGTAQVQPAGPADMAMRWAHDLHEGQGLGPVWRGLTALVGLALPLFSVTGLAMWLLKRRNRRRLTATRQAAFGAELQ